MSSGSKSAAAADEMEMGEGKSIRLEASEGGANEIPTSSRTKKQKVTAEDTDDCSGSGVAAFATTVIKNWNWNESPSDILLSLKNLIIAKAKAELDAENITKLEETRAQSAKESCLARKAIWRESARKEIEKRTKGEVKAKMESIPLERVTASKGKAALARMSALSRDKLKETRTSFLFHEVFPVLHESGHLSKDEVLNCRTVSKEWEESVGRHLQDYFPKLDVDVETLFHQDPSHPKLELRFKRASRQLSPFYNRKKAFSGLNPFISRKLFVGDWQQTSWYSAKKSTPTYSALQDKLLKWGQELRELLICFEKGIPFCSFYTLLFNMLARTPNLRFLAIVQNEWDITYSDKNSQKGLHDPRMLGLGVSLLTDLPHLKSLYTAYIPPHVIMPLLAMVGPTLESLSVAQTERFAPDALNEVRLPRLKQFFFSCAPLRTWENKFKLDTPLLEELGFNFANVSGLDLPTILWNINYFGGNLKTLSLTLDPMSRLAVQALEHLKLELPHVEKMTLSLAICCVDLNNIDFILPMASLKELELNLVKMAVNPEARDKEEEDAAAAAGSSSRGEAIIQFGNFRARLYESNIWRLFPELKKVTMSVTNSQWKNQKRCMDQDEVLMKGRVYTREGYKQHCQDNEVVVAGTSGMNLQ